LAFLGRLPPFLGFAADNVTQLISPGALKDEVECTP
jgi:hypothetical protein